MIARILAAGIHRLRYCHRALRGHHVVAVTKTLVDAEWLPADLMHGIFVFGQHHVEGDAYRSLVGYAGWNALAGDIADKQSHKAAYAGVRPSADPHRRSAIVEIQ